MRLDKYSNPVFNESDLFDALYQGHQFNVADTMLVERTDSVKELEKQIGFKFLDPYETHFDTKDYDQACQTNWLMPDKYKTLDIEEWLLDSCPEQNHQRLIEELQEYKSRNMLDLLRHAY